MPAPAPPVSLRRFGIPLAILLMLGLPSCDSGGGGGGPTSPTATTREICAMNAETGEIVAMVLKFLNGSPSVAAPQGCAQVSTGAGALRIDAAGLWVRTIDASEQGESGDLFALVPVEGPLTARLRPYLADGLKRAAGKRLPDEFELRQTAEVILGAASDEVAIRAALGNVPRLTDGQLDTPTVNIVDSAAEFTGGAGYPSYTPKGTTEVEEYFENAGFTAGAKIAYESGLFRLDRELTHLLWHVYLNASDNHPTGGVGDLASLEFDALDDRVFAILFRLRQGSTPETYGLDGIIGTGGGGPPSREDETPENS